MYSHENLESLFMTIGKLKGAEYSSFHYYSSILSPKSVWPNQLNIKNIEKGKAKIILEEIEEKIKKNILPSLLVLNPNTDNSELIECLNSANYKRGKWVAMSYLLTGLKPEPIHPDLEIKEVHDKKLLKTWVNLIQFELMGNMALDESIFIPMLNNEKFKFFLGFENGTAVSTAFVYLSPISAGIYCIATKASNRGKGLGKAMARHCLEYSKKAKRKEALIQATDLGYPIYLKLGFKEDGIIDLFSFQRNEYL